MMSAGSDLQQLLSRQRQFPMSW